MNPTEKTNIHSDNRSSFRRRSPSENEISIHIWNKPKTTWHGHQFYEFAICTKGKLVHYLNDDPAQTICEKQTFLITPDDFHNVVSGRKEIGEHINVSITTSMFTHICEFLHISLSNIDFCKLITLTDNEYAQITTLINNYFIHLNDKKPEKTEGLAKFIVTTLIFAFSNHSNQSNDIPKWLVDFTNQLHMEKNIALSVSELYPLSGYSQTSLSKAFRKYYNMTLVDFFNRIKIQYAYNLIKNTNLKIISIATMIGFDSLSHFNYLFKKITGMTPSNVRIGHTRDKTN